MELKWGFLDESLSERPAYLPRPMRKVCFVHVDHLKSTGCKLPAPVADNGAELAGLPHEKEPAFLGPMTSGSSFSLKSPITGCTESMEDYSVPK